MDFKSLSKKETPLYRNRDLAKISKNFKGRKFKNSTMCEIMQIKYDLEQAIKHNKLRRYGHAQRMNEQCLPKIVFAWIMKWRQIRCRQRITLKDCIEV